MLIVYFKIGVTNPHSRLIQPPLDLTEDGREDFAAKQCAFFRRLGLRIDGFQYF